MIFFNNLCAFLDIGCLDFADFGGAASVIANWRTRKVLLWHFIFWELLDLYP